MCFLLQVVQNYWNNVFAFDKKPLVDSQTKLKPWILKANVRLVTIPQYRKPQHNFQEGSPHVYFVKLEVHQPGRSRGKTPPAWNGSRGPLRISKPGLFGQLPIHGPGKVQTGCNKVGVVIHLLTTYRHLKIKAGYFYIYFHWDLVI